MAYDRWAMTTGRAEAITGRTVTDALLEAAEGDVRELIGWAPNPDRYNLEVDTLGAAVDVRVDALGRAIAWQAAHRLEAGPLDPDGQAAKIASESVGGGDYSVGFEPGGGPTAGGPIAARARRLLARGGWLARTGAAHTRP